METKRCLRCHKLLRAEAQVCSRCGSREFSQDTRAKQRSRPMQAVDPSLAHPPASPHRAGHYSGLHPEDQPYQSSFLPAQHPPSPVAPVLEVFDDEPERGEEPVVPPARVAAPETPLPIVLSDPAPRRRVAALSPLPQLWPQRGSRAFSTKKLALEAPVAGPATLPPAPPQATGEYGSPGPVTPRPRGHGRAVPLLLITSGFLFLVATSILGFLLLNMRPQPQLVPTLSVEPAGALSVGDTLILSGKRFEPGVAVHFTLDAKRPVLDVNGHPLVVTTYATGTFLVQITIPPDWPAGNHIIYATDQQNDEASVAIAIAAPRVAAPRLQLGNDRLDFGADRAGAVTHKMLTLINAGGGHIIWQASSDAAWLTIQPDHGKFSGRAIVTLTVNRGGLAPRTYTGHITFSQAGAGPVSLTATMAVNPPSANLVLSAAALTFNGTTALNPPGQVITLQNTGGQPLDWNATLSLANGGNWLSFSPASGHLEAGAQGTVVVNAASSGLSAGSYQGTLIFSYAGTPPLPVFITLIVTPPPVAALTVQPSSLTFNAIQGQNPAPQSFTITDSGNAPLNWGIIADANAQAYTHVSQSRGTLAPAKSVVITVSPSIVSLSAGVMNAQLTIVDTDAGTPVKAWPMKITVTIVNQAVISLSENAMSFSHDSSITVSSQLLIITNAGSAPLNWAATIENSSPVAWLSVDNSGGTLGPGATEFINVTVDSSHLSPGTFTATLYISDTDAGTPVQPQTVAVTVVVT